jgi:hypothetical protein
MQADPAESGLTSQGDASVSRELQRSVIMPQPFKSNVFFALIGGLLAGAALATMMGSTLPDKARPATKRAIRAGLLMYGQARQLAGELAETASDLIAEVQAELEDEHQAAEATEPQGEEASSPEPESGKAKRKSHA